MTEVAKMIRTSFCHGKSKSVALDSISNMVASGKPNIEKRSILYNGTEREVIIKRKDIRILLKGIAMLAADDHAMKVDLLRHHKIFGYNQSYRRESSIYQNFPTALQKYLPAYLGTFRQGWQYALVLGYIGSEHDKMRKSDYERILSVLTDIQAHYYNQRDCVKDLQLNYYTARDYKVSKPVLRRILETLDNRQVFTKQQLKSLVTFAENCDRYYEQFQSHHTLTHNDFSYRNIILTNDRAYFYDWELAAYQNPEHDLVEFLAYHADLYTDGEIDKIIRYYYRELKTKVVLKVSDSELLQILQINLCEFAVNRLSLLRLASQKIDISIADKVAKNTSRLMDLIGVVTPW